MIPQMKARTLAICPYSEGILILQHSPSPRHSPGVLPNQNPISDTAVSPRESQDGTRRSRRLSKYTPFVCGKTLDYYLRLFHGNFVLDSAVPTKLLERCTNKSEREFTFMRYSAATCDPNDFKDSGFTLRQVLYDPPRRTELFIVLTMYNEDEELFARSMHGVMKNVAHLCKRERSKTWGKDGWKKVVVCIVSDGRAKVNSRTLSAIAAMGVYQEGIAKNAVNGKPVTAHIYEYTTQGTYFSCFWHISTD